MKKYNNIFNKKVTKLNKIDLIIITCILFICSIFSFINLGNIKSPNTFYRFNDEDIIIDLKQEIDINTIKIFNGEKESNYNVYISNNNTDYEFIRDYKCSGAFSWDIFNIDYKKTRYIKLEFEKEASIGEIGIYDKDKLIENTYITNGKRMIKELNDEQDLIPNRRSYMNSAYFDETYFATTAYQYVNNLKIYEWTHPPLGKIIQSIPIYITKYMSPFNYRFMGTLAGIILIIVMYIFGVVLFKKRKYGLFAATIMMLDTFRYAQTRMGTVDSYLVLFITISLLYMYLFTEQEKIKYLLLSGLFFGLSFSIKWTGLYSAIPLSIIYFSYLIKNKKINFDHIIYGSIFFVFIPIFIYGSIFYIFNNNYYKTNNIDNIIKQNKKMYEYHSKLQDKHAFSSKWYTWPLIYKPVWYHQQDTKENTQETISGVGNIIIWYASIIGVIYSLIKLIIKKDKKSFFILLCIIGMWFPYIFIRRIMYLYHFFPVLPFFFLALMNLFIDLEDKWKLKNSITALLILSTLTFIVYYPVVSGREISKNYTSSIEIYKTWYF